MARYAPDSRDRVRDATDIGELIGAYVELRRAGPAQLKGLCPFHEERTPSFNVNTDRGFYHCFGCGEGGDAFSFVQAKEGLDFKAALEFLADRAGLQLELAEAEDPAAAARRQRAEKLLGLLDRTATFYARQLWESAEAAGARDYLVTRGLDEALLREFRVGYAPSRWDAVLVPARRAGFSEADLLDCGLASRAKSGSLIDRFRRRITFPLADRRGRVLGFGARAVSPDQQPKYLNSSENLVYSKGRQLYAADVARTGARRAGSVILAEGYTDVIALHQIGLRNAVGLMGTALTDHQALELARMAPTLILALDADQAGRTAALRSAAKAEQAAQRANLKVQVALLPAGRDPADLIQTEGAAATRALFERSVPITQFRITSELDAADLATPTGKEEAFAALRPIFAALAPGPLREEMVRVAAHRLLMEERSVNDWLARDAPRGVGASRSAAARTPPRPAAAGVGPGAGGEEDRWAGFDPAAAPPSPDADEDPELRRPPAAAAPPVAGDPLAKAERLFLAACIASPGAGGQALAAMDLDTAFSSPLHRRAALHLRAGTARPDEGIASDDVALSALMAELVLRADGLAPVPVTVEAESLKLRYAHLERRIAAARVAGEGHVETLVRERNGLRRDIGAAMERAMEDGAPA